MAAVNTWRCFHCDKVLRTREAAREHFGNYAGPGEVSPTPGCKVDLAEFRRAEADAVRLQEELNELLESDRKPANAKPRAKPVKRWSYTVHSDGVVVFHYRDDSERLAVKSVDPAAIVELLNAAGVVLTKARRR